MDRPTLYFPVDSTPQDDAFAVSIDAFCRERRIPLVILTGMLDVERAVFEPFGYGLPIYSRNNLLGYESLLSTISPLN